MISFGAGAVGQKEIRVLGNIHNDKWNKSTIDSVILRQLRQSIVCRTCFFFFSIRLTSLCFNMTLSVGICFVAVAYYVSCISDISALGQKLQVALVARKAILNEDAFSSEPDGRMTIMADVQWATTCPLSLTLPNCFRQANVWSVWRRRVSGPCEHDIEGRHFSDHEDGEERTWVSGSRPSTYMYGRYVPLWCAVGRAGKERIPTGTYREIQQGCRFCRQRRTCMSSMSWIHTEYNTQDIGIAWILYSSDFSTCVSTMAEMAEMADWVVV